MAPVRGLEPGTAPRKAAGCVGFLAVSHRRSHGFRPRGLLAGYKSFKNLSKVVSRPAPSRKNAFFGPLDRWAEWMAGGIGNSPQRQLEGIDAARRVGHGEHEPLRTRAQTRLHKWPQVRRTRGDLISPDGGFANTEASESERASVTVPASQV